ncbi:hypothetical protein CORMATOL_03047 [Corynebacterium matruchotii ATCC 33806]|uniref:Uncharacterized protein n=1 Tax=Corynebacterium matruchotii ATCC 33806 TaxID=566549 RepID=C0E7Q6_9CORY|nr:hypothetical protein CORMATOL_03047 [Corynebacterium matruchotii ATCC 33806]
MNTVFDRTCTALKDTAVQAAPSTHNHPGNQRDMKNNVLPTTSPTPFPQ